MKPCVTVSLVGEARGGPFIFWDDLAGACASAQELGFAAIELFPPSAAAVDQPLLRELLAKHQLRLASLGTGAGWVKHKLTLTSNHPETRNRALDFIKRMMDVAANFEAAVIVGSMQGRFDQEVSRSAALNHLGAALTSLADYAKEKKVVLLYEHLNRYETNLLNRIEEVVPFLAPFNGRVKILADLFHMGIEEANLADALRLGGSLIGHVHLADSNRRPAGLGHTDFSPIFKALREISYEGFVSAEALPYPDSFTAARLTIEAFRKHAAP